MQLGKVLFFFFCLVAFFFGYLTYRTMFSEFGPELWIFIPDCPLYVGLLLLIVLFDIKNRFVRFLAAAGLVKYGLWTLMVFAIYPDPFLTGPYLFQTTILTIGHLLMVFASLVVLPKKLGMRDVLPVLAWFFFNDYMDYWMGTKPIFPEAHLDFVVAASIALSIFSVFVLYWVRGWRELWIIGWTRRQLGVSK